jgi:hypothetical protein
VTAARAVLSRAAMIAGMAGAVFGLMRLFAEDRPARILAQDAPAGEAVLAMAAAWNGNIRFGAAYAALDPARVDFDAAQGRGFDPADDYWGLPRTPGYEEIAARCSACHSLALVMQQRQTKAGWAAVIDRMVARQGMAAPEPQVRSAVIAYLVREYGRE